MISKLGSHFESSNKKPVKIGSLGSSGSYNIASFVQTSLIPNKAVPFLCYQQLKQVNRSCLVVLPNLIQLPSQQASFFYSVVWMMDDFLVPGYPVSLSCIYTVSQLKGSQARTSVSWQGSYFECFVMINPMHAA